MIEPEHLHMTVAQVRLVDRWPARIRLSQDWIRQAHVHGASVNGDTVTINASNGTATYTLRHDLPKHGKEIIADLAEGDTPSRLKQRAEKYRQKGGD